MRLFQLPLLFCVLNIAQALSSDYLDFEYRSQLNKNWLKITKTDEKSVRLLIDILLTSKTGRKMVSMAMVKANREGKTLVDAIIPGGGSLTDTTLIRRFSPSFPDQVMYESRSVVYINKYHSLKDAVLDLAHELTHFVYREPFNPYRRDFSFKEFLVSTVEGKGGEVDAYLIECKIMQEIIGRRYVMKSDCARVKNEEGRFSKSLAVSEFYKVGDYAERYWKGFNKFGINRNSTPWLSEQQAHFISSAYGLPYPLAAYEEYMNIMTKVCENDSKRLSLMSSARPRSPANQRRSFRAFKKSYNMRCSNIDQ